MYLVHESADGRRRVLADEVETADSLLAQTRGLMFRESVSEGYALVFPFDSGAVERLAASLPPPLSRLGTLARHRSIHMLFVRVPLDVLWVRDGGVVAKRTLHPWRGFGAAPADTVVELAAGAAEGVELGDRVTLCDTLDGVTRDWRHARRGRRRDGARPRQARHAAPGQRSRTGRGDRYGRRGR